MFVPLKYTDCTLVMYLPPSIHYGTDRSNHQMLTEQAETFRMCVSIIPKSVDVKSYFRSAVNADMVFCFALDFHGSVHTLYNTWVLALCGNPSGADPERVDRVASPPPPLPQIIIY